jgi:peptidoglycan hydrolase-like amidase
MTRRAFSGICAAVWAGHVAQGDDSISIGRRTRVKVQVLQLLKANKVTVSPFGGGPIEVMQTQKQSLLWPGHSVTLLAADAPFSAEGHLASADASLRLTLPNGFMRNYLGRLSAECGPDGQLVLIIDMSVETAVRSIVGAELPERGAAFEALAAQAVVGRSFLMAGGHRHRHADFCDTTHCQFLRSPAERNSAVSMAAVQTRGLLLTTNGKPFPALYSAACGGETEQRDEAGYLYQRLKCEVCSEGRRTRAGHGLGLCQNAALVLAQRGWTWQQILEKYYPGAAIGSGAG